MVRKIKDIINYLYNIGILKKPTEKDINEINKLKNK